MNREQQQYGYTLIEVIVTIGILGVVISLIVPSVQNARRAADRTRCANNIKQLALALHNYEATRGVLPPGRGGKAESVLSWLALSLPYLGQEPLWKVSDQAVRETMVTYKNPPHVGYATVVPTFCCPSDSRLSSPLTTPSGDVAAFGTYLGVSRSFNQPGVLGGRQGVSIRAITDGASSTLLIGERPPPASLQAGRWYSRRYILERFGGPDVLMSIPYSPTTLEDTQCRLAASWYGPGRIDNPCDRFHFWSEHGGGANFAFADASVHYIKYEAASLLPALASRAGGEVASVPE
jgi:prepilin-type N-terminal cleavage/methylation domain-containing protein/prepilin-type processing-associated H-X9-DG protein